MFKQKQDSRRRGGSTADLRKLMTVLEILWYKCWRFDGQRTPNRQLPTHLVPSHTGNYTNRPCGGAAAGRAGTVR